MATSTAFKFDKPDGAQQMLDLVKDLAKGQWITLQDAAIVTWRPGKQKPKSKHERSWLWPDLIAGLTVAALAVPKSLGSVGIAGVPIQYGLFAATAGAILYALFREFDRSKELEIQHKKKAK